MSVKNYNIKIVRVLPLFRMTGVILLLLAVPGWVLSNVIDYPVANLPHISDAYYSVLSDFLILSIVISYILGIGGFFLLVFQYRQNAQLYIEPGYFRIESRKKSIQIQICELYKVTIVEKSFSFHPFRLEFVHKDRSVVKIIFLSQDDIMEVIQLIISIAPEKLNSVIVPVESDI